VTLTEGQNITCTIINTKDAVPVAAFTVVKIVINDDGGNATSSDFTITVNVNNTDNVIPSNTFLGNENGTAISIEADIVTGFTAFNITETGPSGYKSTFNGTCTGVVTQGQDSGGICTITNDDIAKSKTTRTQGYWSTHTAQANSTWLDIAPSDRLIGTHDMGNGPDLNDTKEMLGGFWADIAKNTQGQQRSSLDKARMSLLQQLLAAMLNSEAFGTDDDGAIAAGKLAFAGTNKTAIRDAAGVLGAYNTSGDTEPFPDDFQNGKATPKISKALANRAFWNALA
ncbi:MAG: hypothetical protein ACRD32_02100, partial [Nitrososphaerales archaeon]